ncbi:MAG: chorismate lyase [Saccharospirillaceae bacterium]|nr:chorismate lyase [Pseudomonadales bacterium]NRB79469.1 chorismate lyase [Saccharospirillaceae bacterium]
MQKISNVDFPESISGFDQKFFEMTRAPVKPNVEIKHWLFDKTSLTQKLIKHFGDFRVEVVFEGWITNHQAKQFFRHALKDKSFKVQRFWFRKVNLICNGKIVVRAHTLVPLQTFHNQTKRIGKLHSKSLGQFLFTHKHIKRQPIMIKHNKNDYWARQSIFYIRNYPLLVTEYFEPDFLDN